LLIKEFVKDQKRPKAFYLKLELSFALLIFFELVKSLGEQFMISCYVNHKDKPTQ
jgi:hypothetical protein